MVTVIGYHGNLLKDVLVCSPLILRDNEALASLTCQLQ